MLQLRALQTMNHQAGGGIVAIFWPKVVELVAGRREFHHPNWRTHDFSKGWLNHQPDGLSPWKFYGESSCDFSPSNPLTIEKELNLMISRWENECKMVMIVANGFRQLSHELFGLISWESIKCCVNVGYPVKVCLSPLAHWVWWFIPRLSLDVPRNLAQYISI